MLYTDSNIVEQNLTKAKEFFGKACELRERKGCQSYKVLNQSGY
ncbi:Sel1 repeat protein [Campylobacter blaseri]|uniref:Sel1 repeat protein n=1 Tax=Campylobacter blaseri TaxID=2042961 RepID=A0A2P8QZR8_9BACT|nr:Sel1 repeat protein [Campylobacter blaseri]PSM51746.1 Sel1 repeat protein [Campylobacter blaseri]PSM53537.1 Sel1 repeat protein [Campylobacter blaseri]